MSTTQQAAFVDVCVQNRMKKEFDGMATFPAGSASFDDTSAEEFAGMLKNWHANDVTNDLANPAPIGPRRSRIRHH